jgi:hypothetical protein
MMRQFVARLLSSAYVVEKFFNNLVKYKAHVDNKFSVYYLCGVCCIEQHIFS